jgi:hypothetical protein
VDGLVEKRFLSFAESNPHLDLHRAADQKPSGIVENLIIC